MRVALFTDGIQPYVTGGMQKHSFYLAKYLARQGVEIELYHFATNKDAGDPETLDIFEEEERKLIENHLFEWPKEDNFVGHYLRASFRYAERVYWEFMEEGRADLIIAKGFAGWKAIERKKAGEDLPPIWVKFHGMNMFQKAPSFKGWLSQFLFRGPVRYNMRNADGVLSYGGRITDIIEKEGVPRERIIELPAGIDPSWLKEPGPLHRPLRFLFVGRYDRLKGIQELMRVLKKNLHRWDMEIEFVGDLEKAARIEDERVRFNGPITDKSALCAIYDRCDVLLCPSHSEGMPNVILEAMAQGLTVVATDVGATEKLVDTDTGWLIDRPDEKLIEGAIDELLNASEEDLKKKKEAAFRKVKEGFLWERIGEELVDQIQNRKSKSPNKS